MDEKFINKFSLTTTSLIERLDDGWKVSGYLLAKYFDGEKWRTKDVEVSYIDSNLETASANVTIFLYKSLAEAEKDLDSWEVEVLQ